MSWSVDAVRKAWEKQERDRVRDSGERDSEYDRIRYVKEAYNDKLIVGSYDDGERCFVVGYEADENGTVQFSEPIPVRVAYVAVSELSSPQRIALSYYGEDGDTIFLSSRNKKKAVKVLPWEKGDKFVKGKKGVNPFAKNDDAEEEATDSNDNPEEEIDEKTGKKKSKSKKDKEIARLIALNK